MVDVLNQIESSLMLMLTILCRIFVHTNTRTLNVYICIDDEDDYKNRNSPSICVTNPMVCVQTNELQNA